MIQEWWGLDEHMADIVDRFAAEGFVTLAPDLFGGTVAHDSDEAGKLLQELPVDRAARDLAGAVDYLLADDSVTSSTVGVVGYCMGGGFVLLLAANEGARSAPRCRSTASGPGVPDTYRSVTAPIQGHYGEQDEMYPVDEARKQEQQIREESQGSVEFFYYPAGHAFHNDKDKLGTYDKASAELAWNRTLEFLRANVH